MANHQVYKAHTLDYSKFSFGDITLNKYGGKSSRVKYNGKDFYLQTPRMRLPYGLSDYPVKDADGNVLRSKYTLDMSFSGYERDDNGEPRNKRISELFDCMTTLEQLLCEHAAENSQDWLGLDNASPDVAKALTRPIVRYSRDKITKKLTDRWPPTLKVKVGHWDGDFTVKPFDENKKQIVDENLKDVCIGRSEVKTIIKLTSVNFAGGKCGYSWQLIQLQVWKPVGMPKYAFLDDEDDDKPVVPLIREVDSSNVSSKESLVDDSDDSDDDESEEQNDSMEADDEEQAPTVAVQPDFELIALRKRKAKRSG